MLGADVESGEGSLTYTWAATTLPSGAAAPIFTANDSNAAKNTTAILSAAGTYGFTVTIADPRGLTAVSSVNVTVSRTLTSFSVSALPFVGTRSTSSAIPWPASRNPPGRSAAMILTSIRRPEPP